MSRLSTEFGIRMTSFPPISGAVSSPSPPRSAARRLRSWAVVTTLGVILAAPNFLTLPRGFAVEPSPTVTSATRLPRPDTGFVPASLWIENGDRSPANELRGSDGRLQLVVSAAAADGEVRDFTRTAEISAQPAGLVEIDDSGLVIPLADGVVTVTARLPDVSAADSGEAGSRRLKATAELFVSGIGQEPPIHFQHQIIPIFTKLGCNGGGCHGKISGQNGFRLSLLGFEPREDFEYLVKESRGRRISPAMPQQSLLITKATGEVPHGGGQRLQTDSYEYRLLWRWIAQGSPYGDTDAPDVESIEIHPASRRLAPGESQQLSVVARYTDGSVEDVTPAAVYESNDPSMAEVTSTGLVELNQLVGDVAVMARFQGHVAVFNADIPIVRDDASGSEFDWSEPRNVVDAKVFDKLRSLGLPPSPPCDDESFLRRATLDIAGRLPTLDEVRSFAADSRPSQEKRDDLIDRLLDSEDYADYFAGKWGAILRNRRTSGSLQFTNLAFYQWIRQSLYDNKPYDQFVGELLTASGSPANNPAVSWYAQVPDLEQRTEDAAQLFLGQRVQCARCHHHPFEKWSQADYAQLAAFFSLVSKKPNDSATEAEFYSRPGAPTAKHPKTGQPLSPTGLDGQPLTISAGDDPRVHLVEWMVAPENPFFAKTLVNRYWKHFLGRGLVEPEDDMRVTNPPSNPALLDAMAEQFVASDYDLKALIRLICQSRTYSFTSDGLDENIQDRRSHSRYYPKRLTAEVLLDAVDHVTQSPTTFQGLPPGTRAVSLPDTNFNSYFLTVFGQPKSTTACECERTQEANLAQSLHLLNSAEVQAKLSAETARAARLAESDPANDADMVRELYQVAFARLPSDAELESVIDYINGRENRREAMEDLVWTLINSKEFLFNH